MAEDNFKAYTDEELVRMWDNDEAKNTLYLRVLPTIYSVIAPFNTRGIQGYDFDDLLQEASFAFAKAVGSYDPERNAKFRTYLRIYVRSHLLNLAQHVKSDSERVFSDAVSIYDPVNSETPDIRVIDTLYEDNDFEENAMREELTGMVIKLAEALLSKSEKKVFSMFYIDNMKVPEIAKVLGSGTKSVENTLYRIRAKFRKSRI